MDYRSNAVLTYVSILHRNTNRYFSSLLEKHRIGSGQQFFLLRIRSVYKELHADRETGC